MIGILRQTRRRLLLGMAALGGVTTGIGRLAGASARTPVVLSQDQEGLEAFSDRNATADDLVNAWFILLAMTGNGPGAAAASADEVEQSIALVAPYLDPVFQLQRASGERYVSTTYVPVDIDQFAIEGVLETRPASHLVVARYAVHAPGSTTVDSSMILSADLAPRLTVFRWNDIAGRWLVASHANFNTPVSTICDATVLTPALDPATPTTHDDVLLGISLVENYVGSAVAGNVLPVLDPEAQLQTAGGYGYTTAAARPPGTALSRVEQGGWLVTRHDDLIVVSCRARPHGNVYGIPYSSAEAPRLHTFRRNEQGDWKVIATAYFSTVAGVPEGVDCSST